MPQLTLHVLTAASDPRFSALLTLYAGSFPAGERKPEVQLRAMLQRADYHFLLAQQDERVLGFAILFRSQTIALALLEYLAVTPEARGQGIGRWLFEQVLLAAGTAERPLLIEAESDRAASPGQTDRRRRKQFYRSLGAREIAGLDYRMPAVSTAPPPPMELLLHAEPQPATVARADLRRWLQTVYTEVYGQSPNDPRLREMLAAVPPNVPIS